MNTAKEIPLHPIEGGYVIVPRIIDDSKIGQSAPHVRETWQWIIRNANHKPYKSAGKVIGRGQLHVEYKDIQEGLKWKIGWRKMQYSYDQIDYAIRTIRSAGMITTRKTTRGVVITICKYDVYQNPKNYKKPSDYDTESDNDYGNDRDPIYNNEELKNNTPPTPKTRDEGAGALQYKSKPYPKWTVEEFRIEVDRHLTKYGKEFIDDFFEYWTQPTPKGLPYFATMDSWCTETRMKKRFKNNNASSQPSITGKASSGASKTKKLEEWNKAKQTTANKNPAA